MLRKTTCAVAGVALACAAALSLSVITPSESRTNLDLRWLQSAAKQNAAAKQDRLSVRPSFDGQSVVSFDLPAENMTIVTRSPAPSIVESAVHTPRPTAVRTISVQPVREVPNEQDVKKERLPTGCEPAFSPVTNPAYAHIGVRCDS
jgi:hypothetical protein